MDNFTLSFLLKIIGLGSASGLLYHDKTILVIGDNSGFLTEYNIETKKIVQHPIIENAKQNIEKKVKPDFESITQFEDNIYIFGSGSTENRNKMVQVDAKSKKIIKTDDVTDLYLGMQSFANLTPDEFNLEGSIYNGNQWFFVNRGNTKKSKNIIFTVTGKNLTDEFQIVANKFKLPKIKGVKASFTDAILVNDKIYFLAAAEDTDSTFFDGEILGSIIGCIDANSMTLDFTKKISKKNKFEGIALFEQSDKDITFLLCEDNDTNTLESSIYKLVINK